MSKNYIYITKDFSEIEITTFGNENAESKNCLIFSHGFKGFKDWGFVPYIAKYFAENNYFVITFNFSHNGIGKNSEEFTELEKFKRNTYSKEIEELTEIVSAYRKGFFGFKGKKSVGLIGHSRGGAITIAVASKNLDNNVNAFATWSAIAKFDRFSKRQKDSWRKDGFLKIVNTRTNQDLYLGENLLHEIENNLLDLEILTKNNKLPYLIIHGKQDLTVKLDEAELLYKWSNLDTTELFTIEATGHTFDVSHPFKGTNDKLDLLLNKTLTFFNNNFF